MSGDNAYPRPVSIFGTKEEKRARFGPPLDPKTMPPKLFSIGEQTFRVSGRVGAPDKVYRVEGFISESGEKWVRWPGEDRPQRAVNHTGGGTEIIARFEMPGRSCGYGTGTGPADTLHHAPAAADERVPLPTPSPAELAAARAAIGRVEDNRRTTTVTPAFPPVRF